jgi:ADP-dependent NAD(P)H-hydrate dehydratase / NAD(P)H-hydrate epimerase
MISLPLAVHSAAQMRALDRHAIEILKIPSYTLMTRAGAAALAAVRSGWPLAKRLVVVCGPGNNGGDGYVLARLARERQYDVAVIAVTDPAQLKGDARRAYDDFRASGGEAHSWNEQLLQGADVIADAILGTGLTRTVDGAMADRIGAVNASAAPVLALDIPSGLHADTGHALGAAIVADRTMTFIGLKLGFYLGVGPDHTGDVLFDGLGVPPSALAFIQPTAWRIDEHAIAAALPRRRRTTHKGAQGRVLIIGGGVGMAGAARMAGEAALRVGAGLVTVATHAQNVASIVGARPELICRGVERVEDLQPLLERADVVAVGPGLGQDEWARTLFDAALSINRPTVIDADGLNLLAQRPRGSQQWILTPHPGEAARLLEATTEEIQADRLGSARAIVERYLGTVVLKGAGTIVASGCAAPFICDRGNPGMATAGMGDVLTGVIAGVAGQTSDMISAAKAGVLVHALAGDLAARRGERGLLASDLFEHLPACVNPGGSQRRTTTRSTQRCAGPSDTD